MGANYVFLARRHKEEPIPGIVRVFMELIRDDDAVELVDGDEFFTVEMKVDPFK
jgi:hypothetical protein